MTHTELIKKRVQFIFLIVYFIAGYFGCSYVNMGREHYFDVALPFESSIPFIPFFIIGYTSVYVGLALVYVLIDDYELFKRTFYFFFLVSSVHFVLFVLIPVKMVRPDLASATGVMANLTRYYYLVDNPVNCFPSLHVSYPLAGTIALWNYKRAWGYVMAFFTVFIAVSVVFVKQHYIMDIAGAVLVTTACYYAVRFLCDRFRKAP
jgi:membrane-associated phospholipid phosphatase